MKQLISYSSFQNKSNSTVLDHLPNITDTNKIIPSFNNNKFKIRWFGVSFASKYTNTPKKEKVHVPNKAKLKTLVGKHINRNTKYPNLKEEANITKSTEYEKSHNMNELLTDVEEMLGEHFASLCPNESQKSSLRNKYGNLSDSLFYNSTPSPTFRLNQQVSDILSDVNSDRVIRIKGAIVPNLTEISDKPSGHALVELFIKEHILKLNTACLGDNSYQRLLYNKCIIEDKNIYKMIKKNPISFARELTDYFQAVKNEGKEDPMYTKDEVDDKDLFFRTTLHTHSKDILDHVADELDSFDNFYLSVFNLNFKEAAPICSLINCANDPVVLKKKIEGCTVILKQSINIPGHYSRERYLSVIATAEADNRVRSELMNQIKDWLQCVLEGLFSKFGTVVLGNAIIIAYLTSRRRIMQDCISLPFLNIVVDIGVALLQAMSYYPQSFPVLYCALGFLLQNTRSITLLNQIMDIGGRTTSLQLARRWPRLIGYCILHWKRFYFSNNREFCMAKVITQLEQAYLKPCSKRASKYALAQFAMRLNCYSVIIACLSPDDLSSEPD